MAPSTSRTKRRAAPDAPGPQTLPPNLRTGPPMLPPPPIAQFPNYHFPPRVTFLLQPVTNGPPAMPPPIATWGTQTVHVAITPNQLHYDLCGLTQPELVNFIMSLADRSPELRMAVEDQNRQIKEAEAAKLREAEERRRKAQQRKLSKPLNYDAILGRVENYMNKETPFSWGRGREMSEAVRVTDGIDKIFEQFLGHCMADSASNIKILTMSTVMKIWDIVISAPCSYTRRQCIMDAVMWEEPTLELWGRLNQDEKKQFIRGDKNVLQLVKTGLVWVAHSQGEQMFDNWIRDMKLSLDDALSEYIPQFKEWDERNGRKESPDPPTTSTSVDLTSE